MVYNNEASTPSNLQNENLSLEEVKQWKEFIDTSPIVRDKMNNNKYKQYTRKIMKKILAQAIEDRNKQRDNLQAIIEKDALHNNGRLVNIIGEEYSCLEQLINILQDTLPSCGNTNTVNSNKSMKSTHSHDQEDKWLSFLRAINRMHNKSKKTFAIRYLFDETHVFEQSNKNIDNEFLNQIRECIHDPVRRRTNLIAYLAGTSKKNKKRKFAAISDGSSNNKFSQNTSPLSKRLKLG